MEDDARHYFQRIQEQGGVIPALKSGFFQQEIADASYQFQRKVDKNEFTIVGVNDYVVDKEPIPFNILKISEEAHEKQIQRLKDLRRRRDNQAVAIALNEVREGARKGINMMEPILNAVKAYATLGEIVNAMKEIYGDYHEVPVV